MENTFQVSWKNRKDPHQLYRLGGPKSGQIQFPADTSDPFFLSKRLAQTTLKPQPNSSFLLVLAVIAAFLVACSDRDNGTAQTQTPAQSEVAVVADNASQDLFEEQVQAYLRLFPYQETYKYLTIYMQGDPANLNTWVMASRNLLKAGEDKVARSNNDTLY